MDMDMDSGDIHISVKKPSLKVEQNILMTLF